MDKKKISLIKDLFSTIPGGNNFIHGDFHPGNVLIQDDQFLLIDFSRTGKGHPYFDLISFATTSLGTVLVNPDESVSSFNSLTKEQNFKLWNSFLEGFLEIPEKEKIDKITEQILPFIFAHIIVSLAQRILLSQNNDLKSAGDLSSKKGLFEVERNRRDLGLVIENLHKAMENFDGTLFEKLDQYLGDS